MAWSTAHRDPAARMGRDGGADVDRRREPADAGRGLCRWHADFTQSSQFGYLTSDRGVVAVAGPGAFADGSQASENAFDARVDLSAGTRVVSLYALDGLDVTPTLHVDLSGRFDRTIVRNRDRITRAVARDRWMAITASSASIPQSRCAGPRWRRWQSIWRWPGPAARRRRSSSVAPIRAARAVCRMRSPATRPLAQVVAQTVEGGVTLTHGTVRLRAGAFRTVSRDDILFVASDQTGFGYFRTSAAPGGRARISICRHGGCDRAVGALHLARRDLSQRGNGRRRRQQQQRRPPTGLRRHDRHRARRPNPVDPASPAQRRRDGRCHTLADALGGRRRQRGRDRARQ